MAKRGRPRNPVDDTPKPKRKAGRPRKHPEKKPQAEGELKNLGGAPKGNTNAKRGFQATRALQYAIDTGSGDFNFDFEPDHVLVKIWKVQLELAMKGDKDAAKFIVERLEGKARQSMEMVAEITSKKATELSDDELAAIIANGSGE